MCFFPFCYSIGNNYDNDVLKADLPYVGLGFDCFSLSPQDSSSHHAHIVSTCRHALALDYGVVTNVYDLVRND